MFHRYLQGDSFRQEGLSQVLICGPPQMSSLAHLFSHLSFYCPPNPEAEKNTCSSQPVVHREPQLTPPSLAGSGPSAHSPQALGCCACLEPAPQYLRLLAPLCWQCPSSPCLWTEARVCVLGEKVECGI